MNRLIFILCMLLASVLGHAAPLDREQAEQRTRAFLSVSHEGSAQRRNMMKISSTPFRYLARSEACYVFGLTSGEGFVVAAADDRLPAVLGYSECALPADATMPQNMRSWLLTYDKE
ncbi:MAG: Spi family protease inhibitor, partial [Prevotella sp.]|nr:Spi family protease inhibitor [Prevotella sp.]